MGKFEELKNSAIKELIKDKEYAEYLCGLNLCDEYIIDIICAAPVSLYKKAEMLKGLASYQGKADKQSSYMTYYNEIQKALDALKLKDNEVFLVSGFTREIGETTQFEAFPSRDIKKVFSYIEGDGYDKENCDFWYVVSKWKKATEEDKTDYFNNDMVDDYVYFFVYDEMCYFCNHTKFFKKSREEQRIIEKFGVVAGEDLNLPTLYKEGDILEVPATPFQPKTRVLVLNTTDQVDCCFPCCMYLGENGFNIGALKHSHIYKHYTDENISPLYHAKKFNGKLKGEEEAFEIVGNYIKGSREKGNEVFNYIIDPANKKITKKDLIKFIKQRTGEK